MANIAQDEKNKNEDAHFYKTTSFEVALIGLIIFFSIARLFLTWQGGLKESAKAKEVVIYNQNNSVEKLPLDKDRIVPLLGGRMQIEVKAGKVRVKSSDCPQHICMNMGWIQYGGQTIACVPNKVLMEIKSSGPAILDAVSY